MSTAVALERVLRRDRWVLGAGLAAVAIMAWAWLLAGAGMEAGITGTAMAPMRWSPVTALLMFAMWWIMMIAMMTPSAAPAVLLFSAIGRKRVAAGGRAIGAGIFLAGYLLVWAGFSLAATALQWGLERAGLMTGDMRIGSAVLGGAILLAAGGYQFTPIKAACLRHCQSPVLFLSTHWRQGAAGALRMGVLHGAYCLGCCWFLMALLFAGGIMNLLWIAGLGAYVALEKLAAGRAWIARWAGAGLALAGAAMILGAF